MRLDVRHAGTCHDEAQVTRLDDGDLVELYVRLPPAGGDAAAQARSIYERLPALLADEGLSPADVVTERLFLADIVAHRDAVDAARRGASAGAALPASTWLQQPPCADGHLVELQVYALRSRSGAHRVQVVDGLPAPAEARLITGPDARILHVQNLAGTAGTERADFRPQCEDLFAALGDILRTHDVPVSQLVRTWIYLRDLERDYDELNDVRNACFDAWGVTRLPASTGIAGGTHPWDWRICADACVLWGEGIGSIEAMHAPTLGEAPEYGSAFSRGLRVERTDRTVLYVSGTASIDTAGNVVHVGDIEGQCHRMLDNVDALLAAQGASLADTLHAVTYLKERDSYPTFLQVCAARGVPETLLNTVVVADVCRPDWLCEIELTALLPAG